MGRLLPSGRTSKPKKPTPPSAPPSTFVVDAINALTNEIHHLKLRVKDLEDERCLMDESQLKWDAPK